MRDDGIARASFPGRTEGVGTSIQPDPNTPAHLTRPQRPTSQRYQRTLPEPWSRLRFAIADHAGNQQAGIVECGTVRMRQGISQLSAFMNGSGSLRSDMTRNTTGKRELAKETPHSLTITADIRIYLAVRPVQPGIRQNCGTTVARPPDTKSIETTRLDHTVEMGMDKIQSGRGAPVTKKSRLRMFRKQWLHQQWIFHQVDLADGQKIRGTPIGIQFKKFIIIRSCYRAAEEATHVFSDVSSGHCHRSATSLNSHTYCPTAQDRNLWVLGVGLGYVGQRALPGRNRLTPSSDSPLTPFSAICPDPACWETKRRRFGHHRR